MNDKEEVQNPGSVPVLAENKLPKLRTSWNEQPTNSHIVINIQYNFY